jgi:hypothetical protein
VYFCDRNSVVICTNVGGFSVSTLPEDMDEAQKLGIVEDVLTILEIQHIRDCNLSPLLLNEMGSIFKFKSETHIQMLLQMVMEHDVFFTSSGYDLNVD